MCVSALSFRAHHLMVDMEELGIARASLAELKERRESVIEAQDANAKVC